MPCLVHRFCVWVCVLCMRVLRDCCCCYRFLHSVVSWRWPALCITFGLLAYLVAATYTSCSDILKVQSKCLHTYSRQGTLLAPWHSQEGWDKVNQPPTTLQGTNQPGGLVPRMVHWLGWFVISLNPLELSRLRKPVWTRDEGIQFCMVQSQTAR